LLRAETKKKGLDSVPDAKSHTPKDRREEEERKSKQAGPE